MIRRGFLGALTVVLSLVGCGSPEDSPGESEAELRTQGGCTAYESDLAPRIEEGEATIERLGTPYGLIVVEALRSKQVIVRPFCDLTHDEFLEVKKSVELTDFPGSDDEQYAALRAGEVRAMRSVERALYGFQWGKHVYLSSKMSKADVVRTLGHETKHVLRGAEHRNYDDQRVACIEEFEAYKAEILVTRTEVTAEEIRDIHAKLRELFDLSKLAKDNCGYK